MPVQPSFPAVGDVHDQGPHTFDDAPSLRHKAWVAGFDPAYWWPVAWSHEIGHQQVREAVFQGTSVAVFRGDDGVLRALEDRCAHRLVKLSLGEVDGCALQCSYHGWTFDGQGTLVRTALDPVEGRSPKASVRGYPVAEKYGLIWVFFGDPALMADRPLPVIDHLEGDRPWNVVPIDFDLRCHPTAIIHNVMDSTHVAALHRTFRTRSLLYGPVSGTTAEGDTVTVSHDIRLDPGGLLRWIVNPLKTPHQTAEYRYPYLVVTVGGVYQLWNLFLPMGPRRCRLFLLPMSEGVQIPGTGITPPARLLKPVLGFAKRHLVAPLFTEDVWSFEAEQQGYDTHHDRPSIDLHPGIQPSDRLTVRKWQEHVDRTAQAAAK